MGRARPLQLGEPYGKKVLTLPEKTREKIRRAILISTTEGDGQIAARLKVEAEYVTAMRERLEGLGVIAKGSKLVTPRKRKPKPSDNFDLFEEPAA